ncbi:hypothetical protein [Spirosoma pomorum]
MEHHGQKLLNLIKTKGFNIQQIADKIPKTRVSVERDIKHEILSRKVIIRYASILGFDVEDFFAGKVTMPVKTDTNTEIQLLRELVQEQRKRLDLQDQVIRFFPNAVQLT